MPNTHTTLTSLFEDIADAIRAKDGTSADIVADNFPARISAIPAGGKEDYSWHQCPTAVRNYIDNVTYTSDYSTTQITDYAPSTPVTSNTKPIGETIDGTTFYNNIPNDAEPYVTTNKAGSLTALDQVRWINSQTTNMRDIGGWTCDGGTVKYGLLYRSGDIVAADEDLFINQLGITMEIDLTADGIAAPFSGMEFICAPTYAMYSISNPAPWKVNLRAVFDAVKNGRAVDFHCSMGADRTGTFACVVEGLLGVCQSDLDKDYELTSFYHLRARNGDYQGGSTWAGLISAINALSGSTFRDKCVNFVASLGFTADEINEFRHNMIDGNPATVTPSISTYTVTKSGSNVTFSNSDATVDQYQTYECDVTPAEGYVIDSITVTMGGVDITSSAFKGDFVNCGEIEITSNGTVTVDGYKKANVNVPTGITPTGTLQITANGTQDVTNYASVDVNVQATVSPRLPVEYQEVEWIKSTGTQNIAIPFTEGKPITAIYDGYFNTTSSRHLVGTGTGSGAYFGKSTNNVLEMGGSVTINVNPTSRMDIGYYYYGGSGYLVANGTTVSRTGSTPTGNWYVFGVSGYMGAGMTLYRVRIIHKAAIIADLIPCYRKSDGVVGMYDIENGAFKTNSGSGTFQKGGNV